MKVKDIMKKVVVVDEITVKDAAKVMADKDIGSVIIIKNDEIAGIVTERDILKNLDRLYKKVSGIMTKNVITIDENDSLEHAASIMTKNKIKRLPVVSSKDELRGIITATDIIANSEDLNEDFYFE